MSDDTRALLLEGARRQFAERGFYGASLALVAGEVGLTKQALLYHFKRKEDLYAEVLEHISKRLLRFVETAVNSTAEPDEQLEEILLGLYDTSRDYPLDTRILVRELLDNQSRAESAKDWYLKPFLSELVAIVQRVPGFNDTTDATAFCMVYQLLGSVEYFAISTATLRRMYGAESYEEYRNMFPRELRKQVHRLIDAHGPRA